MNLIRLTLILLTISKPLINYCDKCCHCCHCCCCKKQNNFNKEYKKDTKSNTTPPNENNDEDYSKINLDYIEDPTLPPNYFTNQENNKKQRHIYSVYIRRKFTKIHQKPY